MSKISVFDNLTMYSNSDEDVDKYILIEQMLTFSHKKYVLVFYSKFTHYQLTSNRTLISFKLEMLFRGALFVSKIIK